MYEIFEHTADLGIRVQADTFDALLTDAGRGLFAVISGDTGQIRSTTAERFAIAGRDPTWLLFDWVSELHVAFELRRMLFTGFTVEVDESGLVATAQGERYDPSRHVLAHEIKAITQHDLDVHRTATGWVATFIVDV